MTELKNYLTEKNISLKDFAKITKVKAKKLTRILDNQAFFSDDEATRASFKIRKTCICRRLFVPLHPEV